MKATQQGFLEDVTKLLDDGANKEFQACVNDRVRRDIPVMTVRLMGWLRSDGTRR
jgi:hypothetical protein